MNRIRCLRKFNKMSQSKFAKLFHVDQTAVSNWEKGKNSIDIKMVEKIAEYFDVPIEFVLGKDFDIQIPISEWSEEQRANYEAAGEYQALLLFKYGKAVFRSHNQLNEKSSSNTDEPSENVIIYHRDGKTVKKHFSKEQMKILLHMIDAIPESKTEN